MLKTGIAAAACCLVLTGCVSMPTRENDGISINRVVERVKCELGRALLNEPRLDSWIGNVTLTLETDVSGSVTPTTNLTGPFNTGTYGLEIGGGVNGKSLQTSLVAINFEVWKLKKSADECPRNPANGLEDALGLQQWVERTFPLKIEEGGSFISKEKAIGYTLEFDLELTGGVIPSFTLNRVSGKNGISAGRKTLNTLQIAMVDAGIIPPKAPVSRTILEEVPDTGQKTGGPDAKFVRKNDGKVYQPKKIIVESRGRGPSAGTQERLNSAIQQLQLRNLRLRQ